jgi:hypothetical protein
VISVNVVDGNPHRAARRRIAMVLREMKYACAAGDLSIKRHPSFETMLPVEDKAQKSQIKVLRFRLIENPEDRNGS